ncbi:MAG: DUF4292 domain-containing protein [Flavobacterium sp.]|jgi:hypothetical protein|uniref:DUF4292 domain-containing protein n=1 Tax=Flavobacterium sp. TaxID=239 RepID=UPI003527A3A2
MKKIIFVVSICFFAMSCKSKKALISEGIATEKIKATEIIKNHYNNKNDFKTLYIKASARYEDPKNANSVTAEVRIQRNEKILVSIRFLGITMAKALITPSNVYYYEKINGTYFEGDYELLSQFLGTELDYTKVENLLIGEAIDDLNKEKFVALIVDSFYKLNTINTNEIDKTFYFEADNFLVKKEEIIQNSKNRKVTIEYPNYQKVGEYMLPAAIEINAEQEKGKTAISIKYNTINLNDELSFPYSVPDGYERIFIK